MHRRRLILSCLAGALSLVPMFGTVTTVSAQSQQNVVAPPGTKVIVEFDGESVGEIIGIEPTGSYKVRLRTRSGKEMTPVIPTRKLRLAPPGAVFGAREAMDAFSDAARNAPPRADVRKRTKADIGKEPLAGVWRIKSVQKAGKAQTVDEAARVFVLLDSISMDGITFDVLRYDMRPRPATIDLGDRNSSVTLRGIFEYSGDDLKICVVFDGRTDRPRKFETSAESGTILFVCKRGPLGSGPAAPPGNPGVGK
jgi:uncharacterized protein (TIGR03067 family)